MNVTRHRPVLALAAALTAAVSFGALAPSVAHADGWHGRSDYGRQWGSHAGSRWGSHGGAVIVPRGGGPGYYGGGSRYCYWHPDRCGGYRPGYYNPGYEPGYAVPRRGPELHIGF
jgi:hypothetical protein